MSNHRRTLWIPALLLAAGPLVAGCGGSDESDASATADTEASASDEMAGMDHGEEAQPEADRVIEVTMEDNTYEPSTFQVEQGETVTFRFTNNGSVVHEAVIGDEEGQQVHGQDLAEDGIHSHASGLHGPAARDIAPGATDEITYTFDEPGTTLIGCHEPGHYSTMKATIEVV